jgi:hypothetical protein
VTDHIEELLPEYTDGVLSPAERARVEVHLTACSACREEASLAERARTTLNALPEIPVPFGAAERILRRTRRRPLLSSPFAWRAAGVAAAAAVIVGAAVYVTGLPGRQDEDRTEAEGRTPFSPVRPEAEAPAGAPRPSPAERASAFDVAAYPRYTESTETYSPETLTAATTRFATEAEQALNEGFPATARDFYAGYDLESLPHAARRAVACVNRGVPPDRTVVPLIIEAARFNGTPAYLVVYLRGNDPQTSYDRIQLVVVDREACSVLHFALQRL